MTTKSRAEMDKRTAAVNEVCGMHKSVLSMHTPKNSLTNFNEASQKMLAALNRIALNH